MPRSRLIERLWMRMMAARPLRSGRSNSAQQGRGGEGLFDSCQGGSEATTPLPCHAGALPAPCLCACPRGRGAAAPGPGCRDGWWPAAPAWAERRREQRGSERRAAGLASSVTHSKTALSTRLDVSARVEAVELRHDLHRHSGQRRGERGRQGQQGGRAHSGKQRRATPGLAPPPATAPPSSSAAPRCRRPPRPCACRPPRRSGVVYRGGGQAVGGVDG